MNSELAMYLACDPVKPITCKPGKNLNKFIKPGKIQYQLATNVWHVWLIHLPKKHAEK